MVSMEGRMIVALGQLWGEDLVYSIAKLAWMNCMGGMMARVHVPRL